LRLKKVAAYLRALTAWQVVGNLVQSFLKYNLKFKLSFGEIFIPFLGVYFFNKKQNTNLVSSVGMGLPSICRRPSERSVVEKIRYAS